MTNRNALMTILAVALILAARVGLCTDSVASAGMHVRTPETTAARAASALIARVQRALTAYFEACTSRDGRALDAVTTSDARIEYTLQEAGSYLSVDPTSLQAACPSESAARVSDLWIFPTNDPEAVFVRYSRSSLAGGTEQQLALVELRGERIARMLNFSAPTSLPSAPATVGRADFDSHCGKESSSRQSESTQ